MNEQWKDKTDEELIALLRGWEHEVAHIKNCYGCVSSILKNRKQ